MPAIIGGMAFSTPAFSPGDASGSVKPCAPIRCRDSPPGPRSTRAWAGDVSGSKQVRCGVAVTEIQRSPWRDINAAGLSVTCGPRSRASSPAGLAVPNSPSAEAPLTVLRRHDSLSARRLR
jgi:hypothetical protein